jgi:2-hydroxychromene-2-carboxylate isomerase
MAKLEFWYDFASPYSYLAAMRIDDVAKVRGVEIDWRPFLLGPIFQAQGWTTSPFNLHPSKGRYMVRDMARVAADRGLAFRMPESVPAHSLAAARIALIGKQHGWCEAFSRAVFAAEFTRGDDIANADVLRRLLTELGVDAAAAIEAANAPENKDRLRHETKAAKARGIFGAPSFVAEEGELFWGDDRLEQAVAWASS